MSLSFSSSYLSARPISDILEPADETLIQLEDAQLITLVFVTADTRFIVILGSAAMLSMTLCMCVCNLSLCYKHI